jgi:hypothetical protein
MGGQFACAGSHAILGSHGDDGGFGLGRQVFEELTPQRGPVEFEKRAVRPSKKKYSIDPRQ